MLAYSPEVEVHSIDALFGDRALPRIKCGSLRGQLEDAGQNPAHGRLSYQFMGTGAIIATFHRDSQTIDLDFPLRSKEACRGLSWPEFITALDVEDRAIQRFLARPSFDL